MVDFGLGDLFLHAKAPLIDEVCMLRVRQLLLPDVVPDQADIIPYMTLHQLVEAIILEKCISRDAQCFVDVLGVFDGAQYINV